MKKIAIQKDQTQKENFDINREKRVNSAVVFVKPHVFKTSPKPSAVINFLKKKLRESGLKIEMFRSISGEEIGEQGIIDKHYAGIAKAANCNPKDLPVDPDIKHKFEDSFNVYWDSVINANIMKEEVMKHASPQELSDLWNKSEKTLKLMPGVYVKELVYKGQKYTVVNGFYPTMREVFASYDAQVLCLKVTFDSEQMNWNQFRDDFIGSTDPTKAKSGSIRGTLLKNQNKFGVVMSFGDNGIHGSAGPIEGAKEEQVWFGSEISSIHMFKILLNEGFSYSEIEKMCENPVIEIEGKRESLFDLTEEMDTFEAVAYIRKIRDKL